jgi:hypothetical protein
VGHELRGWELFWYQLACVLTLGGLYIHLNPRGAKEEQ